MSKKFLSSITAIGNCKTVIVYCLTVIGLAACSNIDESDRLVPVGSVVPSDTTDISDATDSIYDAPVAAVPRRVLIEDYTGQRCANCPDATENIHQLQQIYGNLLVPVAIQSDYMGISEKDGGLANELGNTYFNSLNFTPKVKPAVQVSRFYGDVLTSNTDVTFYVENVVPMPTPIDVRVKAGLHEGGSQLADIDVKVICTDEGGSVSGKLQVWVTEDSIVAPQDYLNGRHISDYVHNHVLRATANGTWGEPVSVGGMADMREFHYTAELPTAWKPQNLAIVAFVYNSDEVLQVAKAKVKTK